MSRLKWTVSLFPLFVLLSTSSFAETALEVTSIEIENGTHSSPLEVKRFLPIHEGDPFDPRKVDQAVTYLKKWGRFSDVTVEEKKKRGRVVTLKFILKEGHLISGIKIRGGYPYLSTRLRRLITVHPGDLYEAQEARGQEAKLEAFYERKGYAGTKVTLTQRTNEKKGTIDLEYRIRKGLRYRIGQVVVTGSRLFPHGYFVSQINPLLAYEPGRIRLRLEKIRRDYQKKGYLKARVRLKDLGLDPASKKINPHLEIGEGKRVTVIFEGNRRVSRKIFKEILPLFTEGGYGEYEIEASVQAMLDHYRRLGFQEASVVSEKKDLGREVRSDDRTSLLIRFRIKEGPQTRVKKIVVEGRRQVSDSQIKKELVTKENGLGQRGYYNPKTVEQDFKNLPRILNSYGALEARALKHETVLNSLRDKARVVFSIEEGEITTIGRVRFQGNLHLATQRLLRQLHLREGDRFSPKELTRDREKILLTYANNGYPYADITSTLQREGSSAIVTHQVQEGIEVRVGEILVVGNERTNQKAIERAIVLKRGQTFSYQRLVLSERSLRRTPAFRGSSIETIGLTEKEPVVHLLVKLEEQPKILIDMGASYDTDRSFGGSLNISHLNLLGTTRSGILKMIGGEKIQKGEGILKDPHFFGFDLESSLSSAVEHQRRPGFETVDWGGAVSFLREFTPRMTLLGRYQILRTFFTDVIDPSTGFKEADHTTSKFSFSFNYDRRDSFSDPQRGFTGFVGLDWSNKLIASNFNFIQPKGYFAHYLTLGHRITFLNFARLESIEVFGGDLLPRDQKLFLGGDFSVRGFGEDAVGLIGADGRPAGGLVLMAVTSEAQVRLFENFKFALFLDNGSITEHFVDIGAGSLRHTTGAGLRYVTPVGHLRLDYGIKLDRSPGETMGRLHFAFGYAF